MGQAIANYATFEKRGFIIKGLFDVNPDLIGKEVRGIPICSMDELETFMEENVIDIAVLTIPKAPVGEVVDILVRTGIRAILNFAHTDLNLPDNIVVENVHLSDSFMRLSYNLTRYNEEHDSEN